MKPSALTDPERDLHSLNQLIQNYILLSVSNSLNLICSSINNCTRIQADTASEPKEIEEAVEENICSSNVPWEGQKLSNESLRNLPRENSTEIIDVKNDIDQTEASETPVLEKASQDAVDVPISFAAQEDQLQSIIKNIAIRPEVINTHDMLIIRAMLPEGITDSDCDIAIKDGHVSIKWLPAYVEQLIPLPGCISKDRAAASLKDGILEIKIFKDDDGCSREINIHS